jgi:hypothetical protein
MRLLSALQLAMCMCAGTTEACFGVSLLQCNFREFQVGFKMYVIFGKCTVHASHESKYTPVWVPLVVLFHIHIIWLL